MPQVGGFEQQRARVVPPGGCVRAAGFRLDPDPDVRRCHPQPLQDLRGDARDLDRDGLGRYRRRLRRDRHPWRGGQGRLGRFKTAVGGQPWRGEVAGAEPFRDDERAAHPGPGSAIRGGHGDRQFPEQGPGHPLPEQFQAPAIAIRDQAAEHGVRPGSADLDAPAARSGRQQHGRRIREYRLAGYRRHAGHRRAGAKPRLGTAAHRVAPLGPAVIVRPASSSQVTPRRSSWRSRQPRQVSGSRLVTMTRGGTSERRPASAGCSTQTRSAGSSGPARSPFSSKTSSGSAGSTTSSGSAGRPASSTPRPKGSRRGRSIALRGLRQAQVGRRLGVGEDRVPRGARVLSGCPCLGTGGRRASEQGKRGEERLAPLFGRTPGRPHPGRPVPAGPEVSVTVASIAVTGARDAGHRDDHAGRPFSRRLDGRLAARLVTKRPGRGVKEARFDLDGCGPCPCAQIAPPAGLKEVEQRACAQWPAPRRPRSHHSHYAWCPGLAPAAASPLFRPSLGGPG